jgi:peptide/nickel transport system ATP-binding protein
MSEALLEVRGLDVAFDGPAGPIRVVRGLDLHLAAGEVLGVVGESGSGKSVAMRAILGLLPGTARIAGSVRLLGEELIGRSQRQLRGLRGARMSMIFQDPMTALNPVLTIGAQIAEAIAIHNGAISRRDVLRRAHDLLDLVAMP